MKQIYTSIDLGSDTIKVVVCEFFQNKLNLLAASSVRSKGIKKGLVVDPNEARESLSKAVLEVEDMLGIKLSECIVTIPSYFNVFEIVQGKIKLEEETKINSSIMDSLYKNAISTKKDKDNEIINLLPIDFKVNGKKVDKPLNYIGSVIELRAVLVLVPKKNILSVTKLIESLDIKVKNVSLTSIGDVYSMKTKDVEDKVGAIVNIGSDITTVSLYNKGILVKSSILNFGGKNITKDISYIYSLNSKNSRMVKEKFALAHTKYANAGDNLEIENINGEIIKVNQLKVSEVVNARVEEMLISVRSEINLLTNHDVDYIILTGGSSKLSSFNLIVNDILGSKASVGEIRLVGLRHNKFSSAVGNIVYYVSKYNLEGNICSMIDEEQQRLLSSPKKSIIKDNTMLGKVFGYFFNE